MAKKIGFFYLIVLFFVLVNSCQKEIQQKEAYRKGKITIGIDPSFLNVGSALVEVFKSSYPEAQVNFKPEVEDLVIADFIQGKITMAMVSRNLSEEEGKILFAKTRMRFISTQIACDAIVLVTSKESLIDSIRISDLKKAIEHSDNSYVFDGGNSSNFNTLVRKLQLNISEDYKITALNNADQVINYVYKNKSSIGIIGLNALSDTGDPKVKEYLNKIKIIPVINFDNQVINPSIPNLRSGLYPFTKRIFLLNSENSFLLGSSFSRFAGSQRGQLIVTRAGLQPYFLYERRVQIN
ncbi:PstS family phosphate ABC transporter substrate-binding protein [Apibacter adventoris]|uniref:PBP domain-containing protein n=1 Tax=Apibacter adventoris TaxID=1679466 RepID=A0A2S8A922_9FLAO|nr:substrate-binding domain-containing protein [Apibacter adventoris]PQL91075.1 hypothetical protein C4S77_09485 [Apibacter adventoris]